MNIKITSGPVCVWLLVRVTSLEQLSVADFSGEYARQNGLQKYSSDFFLFSFVWYQKS